MIEYLHLILGLRAVLLKKTIPRMPISWEPKLWSSVRPDHLSLKGFVPIELTQNWADLDFGFEYCRRLDNLVAEAEAVALASASAASQTLALVVGCFEIDYFDSDSDWLHDGS